MNIDSNKKECIAARKLNFKRKRFLKLKGAKTRLSYIHSTIEIDHGNINAEYNEQIMAVRYIKPHHRVLEIGSNIGRNSLVIATILKNPQQLVTLESSPEIYEQLLENKNKNKLNFISENKALSYKSLIQKDWQTIPSDILLDGYHKVDTITFQELEAKYNIEFDTLVLDCEGAFYYILKDYPCMLKKIKLILMENDYTDIQHKKYIDNTLKKSGFRTVFKRPAKFTTTMSFVCMRNFYEVWKRVGKKKK